MILQQVTMLELFIIQKDYNRTGSETNVTSDRIFPLSHGRKPTNEIVKQIDTFTNDKGKSIDLYDPRMIRT